VAQVQKTTQENKERTKSQPYQILLVRILIAANC
jgi:hypothetical protein